MKLFAAAFPKLFKKIRFPDDASGFGIKPISREGTERLVRAAIEYAIANKRKSVTLVHKGNIMKFTEGAFRDWGYELAKRVLRRRRDRRRAVVQDARGRRWSIKDVIADIVLAAGPDAAGRLRRHRHAEPERRLPVRRAARRRSAASASRPAATSTTSPATPSSKPRTARRRSTPTRTRSIPGSVILSGEMMLRLPRLDRGGRPDREGHRTARSPPSGSPTTSRA